MRPRATERVTLCKGSCVQVLMCWVGAVYMLDKHLKAQKMFGPVSISNGIVWTSDKKTMYYIDTSEKREVQAFDYDDQTGKVCEEHKLSCGFANVLCVACCA